MSRTYCAWAVRWHGGGPLAWGLTRRPSQSVRVWHGIRHGVRVLHRRASYRPLPCLALHMQPAATHRRKGGLHNEHGLSCVISPTVPCRTRRLLSTFKWEPRKGWDVLLEAYLTEFTAEDNVSVIPYEGIVLGFLRMKGAGEGSERICQQDVWYESSTHVLCMLLGAARPNSLTGVTAHQRSPSPTGGTVHHYQAVRGWRGLQEAHAQVGHEALGWCGCGQAHIPHSAVPCATCYCGACQTDRGPGPTLQVWVVPQPIATGPRPERWPKVPVLLMPRCPLRRPGHDAVHPCCTPRAPYGTQLAAARPEAAGPACGRADRARPPAPPVRYLLTHLRRRLPALLQGAAAYAKPWT